MTVTATHERIQVQGPIDFIKILDISIYACGNEHGNMSIQGYLDPDSARQESCRDLEGQVFSSMRQKECQKIYCILFFLV